MCSGCDGVEEESDSGIMRGALYLRLRDGATVCEATVPVAALINCEEGGDGEIQSQTVQVNRSSL